MIGPGSRIGSYEIVARLGAGGMGEVYRARDTRLPREAAIKVLPPELAADTERRKRLEQEAQSASALNHPAIVTVYEVGSAGSDFFIAMEFVEGQTLREMLNAGALPVRRALEIGAQVADGLAKAHAAGIVHRDLKPENVILSSDGFAKILDFGLAKLMEAPLEGGSRLPTAPGVVLGTVGYMSPEQASGRPVDFRSDQFSLGAVLYEMLAGKRAFERETGAETLTAIIRDDPAPLSTANPSTPAPVRWIVERCLAKDPKERYASTSDLARDLKTVREHLSELSASGETATVEAKPRRRLGWVAVAAAFVLGALASAALLRVVRTAPALSAPVIRPLTYSGRDFSPAVSPDGKTIAFASSRDGRNRIWLKQLSSGAEAVLTEGPDDLPRFSPDGSTILFIRADAQTQSLFRQSLVGGEVRRIARDVVAADWSPDGARIVFVRWSLENRRPVVTVWIAAPDGSGAREIARLREVLGYPRFSPDSRRIAVSSQSQGGAPAWFVIVGLDGSPIARVQASGVGVVSAAAWVGEDEIVYSQALSASGAVVGVAGRIVSHDIRSGKVETLLFTASNGASMNVAGDGRLIFDSASSRENLREVALKASGPGEGRWLTRGQATDRQPAYSPDGEWVLFSSNRSGNLDLWEISTKSGSVRRLTDDAADDWDPGFTPDGTKILWSSNRSGPFEIWIADADGGNARQLSQDGVDAENPTASPDGQWIFYASGNSEKIGLWKIRADGTQATRIIEGRVQVPDVSPDGRFVAYASLMDGTMRVVRAEDGVSVLSTPVAPTLAIGTLNQQGVLGRPRWMPGGKAIAFVGRDENGVNGVFVQDFVPGTDTTKTRRKLTAFDTDTITESLGISPDGARLTVAGVEPVFGVSLAENVPGVRRRP